MTLKRRGMFSKKHQYLLFCYALNYKQTRPRLPQAQELAEGAGALPDLGGGGEEDQTGRLEEEEENPDLKRQEKA